MTGFKPGHNALRATRECRAATHKAVAQLRCLEGRLWGMKTSSRPLGPGGRCRFGQATFTGTHGNERDAPKPATRRKPCVKRGFPEADVRDPVTTSTWLCPPLSLVTRPCGAINDPGMIDQGG